MSRVYFVDVFRYRYVFAAHSFVCVTDPIVFRAPYFSVANVRGQEITIYSKGALCQRVTIRGSDRVGKQFGLHVFNILREAFDVFALRARGVPIPVRNFKDPFVSVGPIDVSSLDFEDPSEPF